MEIMLKHFSVLYPTVKFLLKALEPKGHSQNNGNETEHANFPRPYIFSYLDDGLKEILNLSSIGYVLLLLMTFFALTCCCRCLCCPCC